MLCNFLFVCFTFFFIDLGCYSSVCRCSGEYLITEHDLENGHNVVCCTDCTLSIRVLYNVLPNDADGEDQQNVNMKNS